LSPRTPPRRAQFCDVHAWMHAPGTAAAHRVHTTIQTLGESPDVFGFIHAGLHQWNYVFHGEEVRAIDFDDCGWGYYTYDRAVTLSYLEDWGTFPALQDTFLTEYQRVRPLPRRYGECLEVFLAARILAMVPWILRPVLDAAVTGAHRDFPSTRRQRGSLTGQTPCAQNPSRASV
jgi:Ser/Thr protein kinase RdoA (MazF antagonist)